MTSQDNKKIVDEFFKRFSASDTPAALALLHEGVSWRVMGSEGGLPMSGEMDKKAIGDLMDVVRTAIPGGLALTPSGWTIEGDRVAVEMESYGKMVNGNIYNNHYHFLITVSGGRITSFREYMDTYHVKKLFLDPEM